MVVFCSFYIFCCIFFSKKKSFVVRRRDEDSSVKYVINGYRFVIKIKSLMNKSLGVFLFRGYTDRETEVLFIAQKLTKTGKAYFLLCVHTINQT